jgi:5'-3' exonuclease
MRIMLVDYMGGVHQHWHAKAKDPCYSFLLGLRSIIYQFRIDRTFILLEGGKSKYRLSKYPEYKAHREDSRSKWTEAERVAYGKFKSDAKAFAQDKLSLFNMEPLMVWGCEADDLAAYLTNHIDTSSNQIFLLSADQDWYQLLRPNVVQGSYPVMSKLGFPLPSSVWLSRSAFEREYEIPVSSWIWKKCLQGDAGDNIKGIPKIGDVTALRLMQRYCTIETILLDPENLEIPRLSQVSREALRNDSETIYRNYELMNLNFNSQEELAIFSQSGINYLDAAVNNLSTDKKPLDKRAIDEVSYECGWIEVLDPNFISVF